MSLYNRDGLGRVTKIESWKFTGLFGSNNPISLGDQTYTYDAGSRVTSYANLNASTSYSYDHLNQLTSATRTGSAAGYGSGSGYTYGSGSGSGSGYSSGSGYGSGSGSGSGSTSGGGSSTSWETFTYDANGNRISATGVGSTGTASGSAAYSSGTGNLTLTDGTYTYEYDNEGQRTKRTKIATGETTEYQWDQRHRLTAVLNKAADGTLQQHIAYEYDAFDRLVTRKVGGGILANFDTVFSRFYDDVTGNLLSTVENNQSSLATRFISGDDLDQVFAQIRYSNGQLQTYNWWVTDLEGTPHQIMSEEATAPGMGSLLAQDYTAYGRPVDTNGAASAQPLPASYQAGYTARDYDEISGLQWNRARWYDPVLGQWLSDDPISFSAGDSNIRRYVGNSPTNATDPSGLAVLFGHEVLAPWDSRASWNPITTVKTWAGMGGVAISGVAGGAIPGAAGGAMTGGAVGGTVGLLGGPVGSGGGILAGAGAGGISGGISGGLNGLIKASRAETPGLTDAFRKGWDGSFTAGMVSGVVPGATAAAGPIKLAGGAMVPTAGGTLVVAPAVIVSTQTTVTAATAVSVPATVAMSGTPKENCETSPETPKGKLEQHHSDPKFMGGDPKQPKTSLPKDTHRGAGESLHNDLNNFLRGKTNAAGNHMRPQRGNSAADIQQNFPRQQRLDALAEFYKKFGYKYPDAARDFFNQHPHLK